MKIQLVWVKIKKRSFITTFLLGCSWSPFRYVFSISVALSLGAVLQFSNITPGGSETRVVGRNRRRNWDNKKTLKIILSLIYSSAPNGLWTACKWFVNQMRICVDGTANLRCAICEWFAYRSLWTGICWFLREHKENWICQVSFPCTLCPLLTSDLRKIN